MPTQPQLDLDLGRLDVDLLIEHEGHRMKLTGSQNRFAAEFSSLVSLFHYARTFWSQRKIAPPGTSLSIGWRGLRLGALKSPRRAA